MKTPNVTRTMLRIMAVLPRYILIFLIVIDARRLNDR
jgi:hypothetical protein